MIEFILLSLFIITSLALLGIIVAVSPTLVVTELAILTKSKKPIANTIAFIAGISLAVLLFLSVAIFFIDPNQDVSLPTTREIVGTTPLIDILIGTLLLVLGTKLLKPKIVSKPSRLSSDSFLSPKPLFVFGLLKMGTSLSSIAAILLAGRVIKTYLNNDTQQAVAALYLFIVSILPFIGIAALGKINPRLFNKVQSFFNQVTSLNWRRYFALGALVFGTALIVSGLINLEDSVVLKG